MEAKKSQIRKKTFSTGQNSVLSYLGPYDDIRKGTSINGINEFEYIEFHTKQHTYIHNIKINNLPPLHCNKFH